jgi:predicted dienelactone hydrolase
VVFLQHPGSDESVWRDVTRADRMQALQQAASMDAYMQRVFDVPAVLDQLARWNRDANHPMNGRLDLRRVGMSGHSFGAVTTQSVSGQSGPGGRQPFTDRRIDAAIIMSPSVPRQVPAARAFAKVHIPWLLMTGTNDTAPIGIQDMASRLGVFPALPDGGKYELVLDGAEHSVFTDRSLPGDARPRDPAHHPVILALSTAFWDAWLRKDRAARIWLDGEGPRSVLAAADRWQRK